MEPFGGMELVALYTSCVRIDAGEFDVIAHVVAAFTAEVACFAGNTGFDGDSVSCVDMLVLVFFACVEVI